MSDQSEAVQLANCWQLHIISTFDVIKQIIKTMFENFCKLCASDQVSAYSLLYPLLPVFSYLWYFQVQFLLVRSVKKCKICQSNWNGLNIIKWLLLPEKDKISECNKISFPVNLSAIWLYLFYSVLFLKISWITMMILHIIQNII